MRDVAEGTVVGAVNTDVIYNGGDVETAVTNIILVVGIVKV
jgi:hypothetical protein